MKEVIERSGRIALQAGEGRTYADYNSVAKLAAPNLKRLLDVKQLSLLVVDEHPSVRRALAERLASSTLIHSMSTAANLDEASDIIARAQPDAVLLGLRAQAEDRNVRRIQELANQLSIWGAALLVLATYSVDAERKAILRAGARRYLLKGIDSELLLKEIESSVHETSSYGKNPQDGGNTPGGRRPEEI